MYKKNIAIVLAAGQGKRMNSAVKKQYLLINEKPVLYYSLKTFEDSFVDEVVLVTVEEDIDFCQKEIIQKYNFKKIKKIVIGGKERYHSVANALQHVEDNAIVFIHDGARPFVTIDILERAKTAAEQFGACVVGMPVKDTIRIVDSEGMAESTPNRDRVWAMQTPQVFESAIIGECYKKLLECENEIKGQGIQITDDAMVLKLFKDIPIKIVEGDYKNIKITTPEDIQIAESFNE